MAVLEGSYADLEYANEHFANRVDSELWTAAEDLTKKRHLITATEMLDEMSWTGYATGDEHAFPRIGSYRDPSLGRTVIMSNSTPERVRKATCELALHLLANSGITLDTGGVDSLSVGGKIQLGKIKDPGRISSRVYNLVEPLLNRSANTWWRAN